MGRLLIVEQQKLCSSHKYDSFPFMEVATLINSNFFFVHCRLVNYQLTEN